MIMEYYHGLVRTYNENCSWRNSQFRLLPFGFIHVHAEQTENLFSMCKYRGFFEQKIMFDHLYYVFCGEISYF